MSLPLKRALFLIFFASTTACAQERPVITGQTATDKLACEKNTDCAIRQGACGDEPMNIYFDNSELIKMQALVRCFPPAPLTNPRCENGLCVADKDIGVGKEAPKPGNTSMDKYLADMLYCEKNEDCAIRQGSCGNEGEPMNIYYDNSELLAMRPYVECDINGVYVNARCEEGRCVGDLVGNTP